MSALARKSRPVVRKAAEALVTKCPLTGSANWAVRSSTRRAVVAPTVNASPVVKRAPGKHWARQTTVRCFLTGADIGPFQSRKVHTSPGNKQLVAHSDACE